MMYVMYCATVEVLKVELDSERGVMCEAAAPAGVTSASSDFAFVTALTTQCNGERRILHL